MRVVMLRRSCLSLVFLAVLILANPSASASIPDCLTAGEVLNRAVARAEKPQSAIGRPPFTYQKITITEELDPTGKIRERKEKLWQVSIQEGGSSAKLIEVDGHEPGKADLRKQTENETSVRKLLGESKNVRAENRDKFLTPELVARFDFKLVGQTVIEGRTAYEVEFQPKSPERPARHMIDRLLNRLSGTIWIDAEEFELARAQLRVSSEVDFLGGVAGCLKTLAYSMTRTRVAEGLWLPSSSIGDFQGRKLLEWTRVKTRSQASNFKPLFPG
jgi:hypothetical protein